jgi:regulatory LuxR family protein
VDNEQAPHATGVSAREAEVLAGVAEHLTNAEIAERLVISVRTVAETVLAWLRDREILLVLDNCEHRTAPASPDRFRSSDSPSHRRG